MSDDTTTNNDVVEQAGETSQPEETIISSAESLRSDSTVASDTETPEPQSSDNSESSVLPEDEELYNWAKAKGADPNDPKALLKLAKDIEKGFKKYSEKTSQLQKSVKNTDLLDDNDAVIQEARVLNFYATNPDARDYDGKMGEIVNRFEESDPVFAEHLMKHLDTLYAMAKAETSSVELQAERQRGRDEAIEETTKAQTASAPRANAVSSQPAVQTWTDERVREVIAAGQYDKYRNEILAWERSTYGV